MNVVLKATSKKLDFENVIEVAIDLFKWKNKWYIEDIYYICINKKRYWKFIMLVHRFMP